MLKKFMHGLVFGAGAGVAFVVVWLVAISYVIPSALEKMTTKTPNMSGAREATVRPVDTVRPEERSFTLHKGAEIERKIPSGGGMLSISVLEDDGKGDRPSTFQAWVTESEAYIIKTVADVPTLKRVDYPKTGAVDYASELITKNVGFKEQNITTPVSGEDVRRLKRGNEINRGQFYNGIFRITEGGVVFFLPNQYEHNE
jgi:hypothetical protein